LLRRWSEGRRFLNAYGPTEATVCVTCAALDAADIASVNSLPIGRPIANVRCYVVDRRLAPVPVGVPGELLVGGTGVARGYLGRPALTAERFVPDPFSGESGARLYRTGDLVRWRADGRLEFLGRIDAQVKVRGYRIEPGEIEAVLAPLASVQNAAVVARADRLIAYVVPAPDHALTTAALESAARRTLPDYMVPSAWVEMDALPLTPNGKVDRAALPDPAQARSDAAPFVAPRNSLEELVAGIWGDLLDVAAVGVHDNFFKLGGHSLLAAQFLARIHAAFGIEVPLRTLFEAPTVAEFSEALETLPGIGRQMVRIAELYLYVLNLSDAEVEALLVSRASKEGVP
jgi:acyl carrier protein